MGLFNFWRPLTSYAFLIMMRATHFDDLNHVSSNTLFMCGVILAVFHLIYIYFCSMFVYEVTYKRRWLTLLVITLYAGWIPFFGLEFDSVYSMIGIAKNLPEPLVATCIVISLTLLLRRKYYWALLPACTGVLFKEIAFVTWPVAVLVLLLHKRWGDMPKPAIALWVMAFICMLYLRYLAVGISGAGLREHWFNTVVLAYHLGAVLFGLLTPEAGVVITAALLSVAAIFSGERHPYLVLGSLITAVCLGAVVQAAVNHVSFDVALTMLLVQYPVTIIWASLWMLVFYYGRSSFRLAAPYYGMVVIAAFPTWVCQESLMHTRYEADLFYAIFTAMILGGAGNSFRDYCKRLAASQGKMTSVDR